MKTFFMAQENTGPMRIAQRPPARLERSWCRIYIHIQKSMIFWAVSGEMIIYIYIYYNLKQKAYVFNISKTIFVNVFSLILNIFQICKKIKWLSYRNILIIFYRSKKYLKLKKKHWQKWFLKYWKRKLFALNYSIYIYTIVSSKTFRPNIYFLGKF